MHSEPVSTYRHITFSDNRCMYASSYPGITDLGTVGIDGSGTINLAQFALHVSKAQTHISGVLVRKDLREEERTQKCKCKAHCCLFYDINGTCQAALAARHYLHPNPNPRFGRVVPMGECKLQRIQTEPNPLDSNKLNKYN